MKDNEGEKLVVGMYQDTQRSNQLKPPNWFYSPIRGLIANFDLDESTALTTSIFLDNDPIEKAEQIS